MKKFGLFSLIGVVVGLYTTFVVENLWNWFATSALHVRAIPFWGMYGLILLIGALMGNQEQEFSDRERWKLTMVVLDACVPDAKRKEVDELIETHTKVGVWLDAGSLVFARLAGNTFLLVLGFLVHLVLAQ
jgi:hypothetical protein